MTYDVVYCVKCVDIDKFRRSTENFNYPLDFLHSLLIEQGRHEQYLRYIHYFMNYMNLGRYIHVYIRGINFWLLAIGIFAQLKFDCWNHVFSSLESMNIWFSKQWILFPVIYMYCKFQFIGINITVTKVV